MSIKKDILTRIAVVYVFFVLLGLGIIAKIIYIQFVEGHKWRAKAKVITYKDIIVTPNRGDICATDGRVLATSIPYFDIRMDLLAGGVTDSVFKENIDSLAICLSNFFQDRSRYSYKSELTNARRLARNKRFYPIAPRKVNYIELQEIKKFPLFRLGENKGGFIPVQTNKRILPHATMAARTIGTVNDGGVSVGIEGAFDYALKGKAGLRVHQRIPGNSWVEVKSVDEVDPEDGADVITTIDVALQDVAEAALRKQLSKHGAEHGCAILMEVATGDIKAIANLKRNDDDTYSELFNYAVGESVEPGSTMKIPTLVALLEDGLINLDDSVNTGNGKFKIYDRTITDSKEGGHGNISVREVFEVSSNVGVVKLVTQNYKGKEKEFIDRIYAMKLNQPLNISIPGEVAPYIKYPGEKYWSGMSMPMMSIGYELRLTPLQILTFYNAVANNGRMVKPRLVKSLVRHGQVVQSFSPEVISTSICSRSTLKKVHEVLEGVVENGTATNLKNPRYKIAGKTGTAQIAKGRRGYKHQGVTTYSASFVGYFPADDPKYSCIVVVNSPSNSVYYGNVVAGPIFKEISDKVYATSPEWFREIDGSGDFAEMPQSKSSSREALTEVLDELDIPFEKADRKAEWVSTARDSLKVELKQLNVSNKSVPNVVGMGLKDALYLLENAGLRVKFQGRGSVRSQSIQAGSKVSPGSTVFLEMSLG
ncbi:MAG: penicillin-binding transpeptidase domain-containing protein [Bacteroidales bacterium]